MLLAVAVPLIFLSNPWMSLWRPLPLWLRLEHTTFLVFGILFSAQASGCSPAPRPLSYGQRIAYLAVAAIPNIGRSMFLAFAQHPLYGHYAALAHRPGGITARADQQLGAGIMRTVPCQRPIARRRSQRHVDVAVPQRLSEIFPSGC